MFELSKCEFPAILERMVGHLRNIDADLARTVADGLGLTTLPAAAPPMQKPRDLPPSDLLSILKNPPASFAGRKIGVLVTDGTDAKLLAGLEAAATAEGATIEMIAPTVGGVKLSDGTMKPAHHKIDGGPSVLFDAVAVIPSEEGIAALLKLPPARDFVSDAYAHCKFIAFTPPATWLFGKVGLPEDLDDGFVALETPSAADIFLELCRDLRFWDRTDGA